MHIDCMNEENRKCLWFDTAHSCSGIINQTNAMLLYRNTTFCFVPPGDSLTRKSLFDSFATGCIPVIFAQATINQYFWHIPPDVIDLISIYIPRQRVVNEGLNVLNYLKEITADQISKMQEKIERIAPMLQYSVVPPGYGQFTNFIDKNTIIVDQNNHKAVPLRDVLPNKDPGELTIEEVKKNINYMGPTWRPPFPDAMDVVIDRILNRSTVEPMSGFTDEQIRKMTIYRDYVLSYDPAYAGLLTAEAEPSEKELVGSHSTPFELRQEMLRYSRSKNGPRQRQRRDVNAKIV